MNATEKPGLTRRQLIKVGSAAAGTAAVVAAVPKSAHDLFSPAYAAESAPGDIVWVDGFARPGGSPPAGPSLQQKRFTAIAKIGGEGFGVDSDDAYHGPSDSVSDFSATEYTITSVEMSDGTLTLQGKVVRAVDSSSLGTPVVISGTVGPPSGAQAQAAGVPTSAVVALTYTLGATKYSGGGVILM